MDEQKRLPAFDGLRWSGEILDCSMPVTFDTYSRCSYRCAYCFAVFQKSLRQSGNKNVYERPLRAATVGNILPHLREGASTQFSPWFANRRSIQWGGMSDPFDEFERRYGCSLEIARELRKREYPVCFSTKGTWWTRDGRYQELFRGTKHFNVKVSIITADETKAKTIEAGVDSPLERLKAIERIASWGCGGATLRLRPFIIGVSNPTHRQLIRSAADAGATAVSTEFLCLETRNAAGRKGANIISSVCGFDIFEAYRETSNTVGYMRMNRDVKRPFVEEMQAEAESCGLRFYVSDADFKERCANGSCCGLPETWSYSRGQFTEALIIAKRDGIVRWRDIKQDVQRYLGFPWDEAHGFQKQTSEKTAKFHSMTMADYVRWSWNDVNGAHSPYKYFGGVLVPDGRDEAGDVIYRYVGE